MFLCPEAWHIIIAYFYIYIAWTVCWGHVVPSSVHSVRRVLSFFISQLNSHVCDIPHCSHKLPITSSPPLLLTFPFRLSLTFAIFSQHKRKVNRTTGIYQDLHFRCNVFSTNHSSHIATTPLPNYNPPFFWLLVVYIIMLTLGN